MKTRFCLLLLFLLTAIPAHLQTRVIPLNGNWQFRKTGENNWLPATVPGTVHTDLLNAGKIPDPFTGAHEKELQWIENEDWEYRMVFPFDLAGAAAQHTELVFDGLDTYASVYLNEVLLFRADNMFRSWRTDISRQLKQGSNTLRIVFESAVRKGKTAVQQLPYTLPGDEKIATRKAQYQYGWDWGPRFVTCGIWKPVRIESWQNASTPALYLDYRLENGNVNGQMKAQFTAETPGKYELIIADAATGQTYGRQVIDKKEKATEEVQLQVPIIIPDARLWWCNGEGKPEQYDFRVLLYYNGKEIAKKNYRTGFRKLELVREKDEDGESFYFRLNGVPVFAKGANWIPADNFLPRVTGAKYTSLLSEAQNANMNMLRVWGGGVYEDDAFYNRCDSLGILVWQDFMYACAMYPGDSSFIRNAAAEAREQVVRLRSHPCIALWCGNNEIDEGWHNWGWQKQYKYSAADSAKIWQDYELLFEKTLRPLVEQNTATPYWPSSPSIGWGHPESLRSGDAHYWGVWWGMEPFDVYEKKTGRFMSEYGFQGMPSMNTILKFATEKDLSLQSEVMKQHQKHPTGYETIQTYLERDYKQPKDFDNYVYVSQLLQAEGMRTAMEAHRRASPFCMGTLYWQFNDCWPVTSWSGIDYYGNRKALHYAAKRAYAPVFLSANAEAGQLQLVLQGSVFRLHNNGSFVFKITTLRGDSILQEDYLLPPVKSNFRRVSLTVPLDEIPAKFSREDMVVHYYVKAADSDSLLAEQFYYFVPPKKLALTDPGLEYHFRSAGSNTVMEIETKALAKNVFVEWPGKNLLLSDNFFDLAPGQKKEIVIESAFDPKELSRFIRVRSLYDSFSH